jgi:hypothetical protein
MLLLLVLVMPAAKPLLLPANMGFEGIADYHEYADDRPNEL